MEVVRLGFNKVKGFGEAAAWKAGPVIKNAETIELKRILDKKKEFASRQTWACWFVV